jgi:chromosome partitioning protein
MRTILVMNPKGGSGKTTLATNICGLLAVRNFRVLLADLDRQQSATHWLARRPAHCPKIGRVDLDTDKKAIKEYDPDWLVVDTPAGLHGEPLADAVRRSDLIIVPVSPSIYDMDATREFLEVLRHYKVVQQGTSHIALVGMRVDNRTRMGAELALFLESLDFPLLATLRDTQVYVQAAYYGLSLFDLPPSRAEVDLDDWRPILAWLSGHRKAS